MRDGRVVPRPAASPGTPAHPPAEPAAPDEEAPRGRTQPGLQDLEHFVETNRLTPGGRTDTALRQLGPRAARVVMGLEGTENEFTLTGVVRNPDAVVMARINRLLAPNRARRAPPRAG